jgi:hypothetical protein
MMVKWGLMVSRAQPVLLDLKDTMDETPKTQDPRAQLAKPVPLVQLAFAGQQVLLAIEATKVPLVLKAIKVLLATEGQSAPLATKVQQVSPVLMVV